jgi:hypothetical protein
MNLSIIKNVFLKLFTFFKFIKTKAKIIIILIGFTYQAIDYTVDYLKYDTDLGEEIIPAISLCVKSEKSYSELKRLSLIVNQTIGDLIYQSIYCPKGYLYEGKYFENCGEKFTVVESVTPFAKICLTFYSSLIENRQLMIPGQSFIIYILWALKLNFILHSPQIPPHLFTEMFKYEFGKITSYSYSSIRENSLPFPYETNCYDYENNIRKPNDPKSYEDCIVKYMQLLEKNNCDSHRRWSYRSLTFDEHNLSNESSVCSQKFQSLNRILMKKCRKSCFKQYFNYHPSLMIGEGILPKNTSYFEFQKIYSLITSLSFNHLIKISFISFLCSMAGLVSMWFGYYLFQICTECFKELKKLIIRFCENFRFFEKFEQIVNRFPLLNKLNLRSLLFTVNFLLLISQLVPVIKNYSESQTQIRLEIENKIYLPYVEVCFDLRMAFKQFIRFNHSMTDSGGKRNVSFIPTKSFEKYSKYLVQLLKNKKFEKFSNHINPKSFLKSCKVSVKAKEFDCENILSRLVLIKYRLYTHCNLLFSNWNSTLNDLTLNNKERFKSLEKVVIKSRKFKHIFLLIFYSYENDYIMKRNQVFLFLNSANFYFETYSIQKLNTNRYKCNEKINNSNDNSIDCESNCIYNYIHNVFGCLPVDLAQFNLILEKDLKTLKYKLCPQKFYYKNISLVQSFLTKINEMHHYCKTQCIPNCNQLTLTYRTDYLQSTNESEDITINLMPKNKFVIRFIEIFQIDFNQLIYECGGILGLWFGIYPAKAADLLIYSLIQIKRHSLLILIYLKKLILIIKTKLILLLIISFDTIVYIMKFFILVLHLFINYLKKLLIFVITKIITFIFIQTIVIIKEIIILVIRLMYKLINFLSYPLKLLIVKLITKYNSLTGL